MTSPLHSHFRYISKTSCIRLEEKHLAWRLEGVIYTSNRKEDTKREISNSSDDCGKSLPYFRNNPFHKIIHIPVGNRKFDLLLSLTDRKKLECSSTAVKQTASAYADLCGSDVQYEFHFRLTK